MLKVVSFDVVGTLVDSYYEDYVWKEAIPQLYARKRGINIEEAKTYILKEYKRISNTDIRWYLPEYWFRHFNLDEDPTEVFRSHVDKVKFYQEVASVVKSMSQKYDLIIVSGATRNVIEVMIEKFRHYFKHICSPVSDCQNVTKTPKFYKMICRFLRIEPCVMAHVGDEWYSDFIAPREIGVKSFCLDRTGRKSGRFVINNLRGLENHLKKL